MSAHCRLSVKTYRHHSEKIKRAALYERACGRMMACVHVRISLCLKIDVIEHCKRSGRLP